MNLTSARWRKSSRSTNNGGACVEVAAVQPSGDHAMSAPRCRVLAVRDSKNPGGPKLKFSSAQWAAFTAGIKRDRYDL